MTDASTALTTRFATDSRVVIDLGMNNGDDTAYYLKKGYRVVAVEANPGLCRRAWERFRPAIEAGRLVVLNAAIWSQNGRQIFHVNLDNDHWSSLDPGWAGREGSRTVPVEVECLPIADLFGRFGVPAYLKIDVEGADELVLDSMVGLDLLPAYLSLEDCRFGYRYLSKLAGLGYRSFQLQDQSKVEHSVDPAVDHRFEAGSSGPFGDALPDAWLDRGSFEDHYARVVRDREGNRQAPRTHWWDIHARAGEPTRQTPAALGTEMAT